ncbi:MAG TPA: hypothetical protein VFI52_05115 [Gemmatimonadaceae bacterium]|nr:hypothetical protein [Gemmatimonadaceae bacterium]
MRRLVALALLLFAPIVVEGCGSDSTAPAQTLDGAFALSSVDGAPLPYTLVEGDPKLELLSDELSFIGGNFTQHTSFLYTEGGVSSMEDNVELGTYTLSGSTLVFRFPSDNSTASATLSGTTITVHVDGHAFVYTKS